MSDSNLFPGQLSKVSLRPVYFGNLYLLSGFYTLCFYASCVSHVWNFGCLRQNSFTSRSAYRFCPASSTAVMDSEDISDAKEFVVDRWVFHDVNDEVYHFLQIL